MRHQYKMFWFIKKIWFKTLLNYLLIWFPTGAKPQLWNTFTTIHHSTYFLCSCCDMIRFYLSRLFIFPTLLLGYSIYFYGFSLSDYSDLISHSVIWFSSCLSQDHTIWKHPLIMKGVEYINFLFDKITVGKKKKIIFCTQTLLKA